ncbi:MAG: hypothetical protein WD059_08570 [Balneolaceae bacterium]
MSWSWIWLFLSYTILELLISGIFHLVSKKLGAQENRVRSVIKGMLERLFLIIGLLSGFPQVIIAFAAIKIGTRFQKDSKVSNDYFLIGNFVSLLGALLFVLYTIHYLGF